MSIITLVGFYVKCFCFEMFLIPCSKGKPSHTHSFLYYFFSGKVARDSEKRKENSEERKAQKEKPLTYVRSFSIWLWATKKIFSAVLRMNSNSHINHGEAVYIIKT